MGWWSATVLGGDQPYDYVISFEEAIGIVRYPDNGDDAEFTDEQVRNAINKHLNKMVDLAHDLNEGEGIAYQVLGALIIVNGAKMTAGVRQLILNGISADQWAKEDAERRMYMNRFRRQVQRYPLNKNAKPRVLAFEGLFDKLFEALADGKKGLINK